MHYSMITAVVAVLLNASFAHAGASGSDNKEKIQNAVSQCKKMVNNIGQPPSSLAPKSKKAFLAKIDDIKKFIQDEPEKLEKLKEDSKEFEEHLQQFSKLCERYTSGIKSSLPREQIKAKASAAKQKITGKFKKDA